MSSSSPEAQAPGEQVKHTGAKGGNTVLYAIIAVVVVIALIVGALYATGAFSSKSTTTTNISISAFTASPASIPVGHTTYVNVSASGGSTPYSYAYAGLPAGCTSANVAILKCVPTASGSFSISVTATDAKGNKATGTTGLVVTAGVAITSFSAIPNPVTVNSTTTLVTEVAGGTAPYTYAYTGLPAGCTSANSAQLNCTPTSTGTFTVKVNVTDSASSTNSKTVVLTVNPEGKDTLAITSFAASPASVDTGQATTFQVVATGGVTPYSYSYTNLPTGCTSSSTDLLSCTPTLGGIYNVTVAVTDAKSFSVTDNTTLTVIAPADCTVPTGQTVLGAGSTLVQPLMQSWVTAYTTSAINYDSVGSGTGISDIQSLSVDYGASDAPMSATQVKAITHGQILTMPEAAGSVAVSYNLGGLALNVNGTWLVDAWTGVITNWNSSLLQALNPGKVLPNQTITLVHRSDGSGTSYVFQEYLSTQSAVWKSTYGYATAWVGPTTIPGEQAEKGNGGVAGYISAHEYSMGYNDLTYVLETTGISAAAVENPSGKFIVPTVNNSETAIHNITSEKGFTLPNATNYDGWQNVSMLNSPGINDYPVATLTYLLFYQQPDVAFGSSSTTMTKTIAEAMWAFINWVTTASEGQSYSAGDYYVPLAPGVLEADKTTLNMMTWGGQPVYPAACS